MANSTELYQLRSDGSVVFDKAITAALVSVAVDSAGNCYLATQSSQSLPMTIQKFDTSGNAVFSLSYAGSGDQRPGGVAIDGSGNIWVAGLTTSNDLQLINPIQGALKGGEDAFIAEFNSTGTLIFSTYFGGSSGDGASGLSLDANGNVYIAGFTFSTDFPTLNPLENSLTGNSSAFLTKIDNTGHLLYSTYLGVSVGQGAYGLATDGSMNMFVTGANVIVKLNPAGSAVVYSVATAEGSGGPIAVDSQGNAYTSGCVAVDPNLCPFLPLVDPIQTDVTTVELVGLDPSGSTIFSTYFGNATGDLDPGRLLSIGTDGVGNLYIDSEDIYTYPIPLLKAANGIYPPFYSSCGQPCGLNASFAAKIALGTGPSFSMPATVDFPLVAVGTNQQIPINIYNTGTSDIAISAIGTSGDYLQTNNCPATVLSATTCSLTITFAPAGGGARNGAVTITGDSPGSPHIILLTGTGGVPAVTLKPTSVMFPAQVVETTSSAEAVTVTNSGGGPLTFTRISATGDFAESNTCGSTLAAGDSCTISVTFTPTATGTRSGVVTITDNAADSPQTVGLTGTGVPPDLALGVAAGSSDSASVTAGAMATYTLTIGGQGVAGTATLTCTGAPVGASCSLPSSVDVSATQASNITVTVSTAPHNSALLARPGVKLGWLWAMGVLALVVLPGVSGGKRARRMPPIMLLVFLVSCGGSTSSNPGGTPTGTYTLTVTATMGSDAESTQLRLTVQ